MGGIGLPMVDRFVRAAGGEVAVESEVGAGTTVTLRLPSAPPGSGDDETVPHAQGDDEPSFGAQQGWRFNGE
jgi:hypothetical protein